MVFLIFVIFKFLSKYLLFLNPTTTLYRHLLIVLFLFSLNRVLSKWIYNWLWILKYRRCIVKHHKWSLVSSGSSHSILIRRSLVWRVLVFICTENVNSSSRLFFKPLFRLCCLRGLFFILIFFCNICANWTIDMLLCTLTLEILILLLNSL